MRCLQGCCVYTTRPYQYKRPRHVDREKRRRPKAGMILYDSQTHRILLIQSCARKWGFPKGTQEVTDVSIEACAIREVREETGLIIASNQLGTSYTLSNTTYFYVSHPQCAVRIQSHDPTNDANGIGWISLDCIVPLYETGQFPLNAHCKRLLAHLFHKEVDLDTNQ
jgi:8-oxo-dGTP pyrophosphatase MutT (NUDIX family)